MAAKKKKKKVEPFYEYIRIHHEGAHLYWTYKLQGNYPSSRLDHDEDCSEYSDADILALTRSMLNVENADPVELEFV